ncbi:MAG TPA: hypothetical protein VI685_13755 [Candidatus Angelobacter sp.]
MNSKPVEDIRLRQYLLGILPELQCDEIEQRLLTDNDFARTIELIEDEIVDDYLDGALSRSDKRLAVRHFFQAPEHRSKLHFGRLLRCHLHKEKAAAPARSMSLPFQQPFYWVASTAIACLLVLTTGLTVYVGKLRHDLESEMAKSRSAQSVVEASLTQERALATQLGEHVRILQEQYDALQNAGQQSSATVTLWPLERSEEAIPVVKRRLGIKSLAVRISVIDFASPSYSATLKDAGGKELWSRTNLKPEPSGNLLVLKIPFQLFFPGDYSVIITGQGDSHTYPLRVS